jgi:chromosomal replication initiation ATPase DnaA
MKVEATQIQNMLHSFSQLVMRETQPPISAITEVSQARYSVSWEELIGKRRDNPRVVMLRRMVSKVFRELGFSFPKIGEVMNRDHGSVQHNVNAMNGMLDIYPDVQDEYKQFKCDVSEKISNTKRGE